MKELFKIRDLVFLEEDFQDNIDEYLDVIPIIRELSNDLSYEEVECADKNDCCFNSKKNYYIEIQGFIDEEDQFITKEEAVRTIDPYKISELDIFVIRVYKCSACNKWMIDILE